MELNNEVRVDLSKTFVFLINEDLHMGAGKIASQVAHVAIQLGFDHAEGTNADNAEVIIGRSIVLYASEEYMLKLIKGQKSELGIRYVIDAGLTEVPKHSLTCLGFRRYSDEFTKGLKLVK